MIRSICAILAGFLTVFILSVVTDFVLESMHIFPPLNSQAAFGWQYLLPALLYRSIYAVMGGYVAAKVSRSKPMRQVWILAIIGFIFATLGLVANLQTPGLWYPILLVVLTIPSVWLGGKLSGKK